MLGEGNGEVTVNYSSYSARLSGESVRANSNIGVRLGLGINERVDLKLRYVRLTPSDFDPEFGDSRITFLVFTPKFSFTQNKSAGQIGVGVYLHDGETFFMVKPKLIFTGAVSEYLSITGAAGFDWFLATSALFWSANLGLALSNDLDRWAARPEIGWMKALSSDGGGSYLTWGIGVSYKFDNE